MILNKKKYVYIVLSLVAIFVLFHALVWISLTGNLFKNSKETGDLGRLSYKVDMLFPRKNIVDLPVKHIRFKDFEEIDVLTIGDSVSNGLSRGKNSFYQDYIASNNNFKVMNISPFPEGYIETIVLLYNSGALDKLKPKIILLESVERNAIQRLSKEIDWNIIKSSNKIKSYLVKDYYDLIPDPLFINKLNYNALIYNILYNFDDNAYFSKTYTADLSKDLFTGSNPRKLLFYYEDLENKKLANQESITSLNSNLNKLQGILDKKNIKLYFMPAADKSNVYEKYIVNNKYEISTFFELLREMPKKYTFIDTKKVLKDLVDKGIEDVYYIDDSHWSYKGSEAIFLRYINIEN